MPSIIASILAIRRNPRIQKLPPYLSLLFILIGITWLFLLPLNDYSRRTYISENALLPGQVHTYFGGSEHNIFRAYRQEVANLEHDPHDRRIGRLRDILRESGLKVGTQKYEYRVNGEVVRGENVYGVVQGPRADATEAVVLIAAWRNMDDKINYSGVALVLTLARYFKRWSLWSKDIIILLPEDSTSGSQAWVDAYHDAHDPQHIESLEIKSGALQGAVAVDYPAGPWGHRFDKLHIIYDGINGQLPNLDLFNTAVNIANGQMGITSTLQRMWSHEDSYEERLTTMLRGMVNQGLGHATGPHSSFIPYHVDAITLQTVGDGWQDEMSLGKTLEGLFRSLNNLLEHLHQSFFFYLLMQSHRFVSIGTYLPSAMLIAGSFTIMAIALWVKSGRVAVPMGKVAATKPLNNATTTTTSEKPPIDEQITPRLPEPEMELITSPDGSKALVPKVALSVAERHMFLPLLLLTSIHFLGLAPLYAFNHLPASILEKAFQAFTIASIPLPIAISLGLHQIMGRKPTHQELTLLLCFSFLLLGMFLSTVATLNFSLAFLVGVAACPVIFVRPTVAEVPSEITPAAANKNRAAAVAWLIVLGAVSPATIIWGASWYFVPGGLAEVLRMAGFGWWVWSLWTQVVVWLIWWPAWVVGGVVAVSGLL